MILRCRQALIGEELRSCDLLILEGRFEQIADYGSLSQEPCLEVEDLVLPGLIDSHIHGYAGVDSMDGPEALKQLSQALPACGVTSFLPTVMTASLEDMSRCLEEIAALCGEDCGGARILGSFAEGPCISPGHRGAQPLEAIRPIEPALVEALWAASKGTLRKLILAPELTGAEALCRWLRQRNILPALGHSSASYEEALGCVEAGACVSVHSYNAMSPLHHRQPGLVGATLTEEALWAELIFDGIHVHPAAAKVLLACKGPQRLVLISDCMRAGGMPDGDYMLGDTPTQVRGGIARTPEGALAGSTLRLLDAVFRARDLLGLSLPQAVKLASENPARLLGLFDQLGSIAPGKRADLIAVTAERQVSFALMGGKPWQPKTC